MATMVLAAAGSALGGVLGSSVAGLGTAAIGKAIGATLGNALDQQLLGAGSQVVETGKTDRFRIMGSSEGTPIARVFGRYRIAGQLIWSSRFLEKVSESDTGGKGGGGTMREYRYSVSLAVALCEGEVSRIGRIWADGTILDQSTVVVELHDGSEDQAPDPLIETIEGAGLAPAYRGTAYVVFKDLDLTPFGNRIPQFNFEVFRRPESGGDGVLRSPWQDVRGVALIPGTGEYSLATEPVYYRRENGDNVVTNVHNDQGAADIEVSLDQLRAELPGVESVSLVVSWFGNDLRCGQCQLVPAVEQKVDDGDRMPWRVSSQTRSMAKSVSRKDGRPIFGGTPADASVLEVIAKIKGDGRAVMFYPFVLMDIQEANGLTDPWTGAANQPPVPWRGRITLARAPGQAGSTDKTAAAAAEVQAFFGTAALSDFTRTEEGVSYRGPAEWSYRRFILHYAHLCALAGGVDAFCIGSELRSLTQVRDGVRSYPAVRALRALAEDVRTILGPAVKIGYAADWSEYFGHHPGDGSGDAIFHLDPLWSHAAIDFVGIDNYMPLSDWRDGGGHADAAAGSIYNLDYLKGNVGRGEGYDWYYADDAGRVAQNRKPITDGAYGEPWVFRYKDILNWWSQAHTDRVGGVKVSTTTGWRPRSKPIWFTELGCPAVNKATNQPNVFYDPKSSESFFPYYSNGSRDDFIQYRYLQATYAHWSDPANNPASDVYAGRMVDMSRAHVWAWDARPWPDFPDRDDVWADGANYDRGHWLNGRSSLFSLAEVVKALCSRSNLDAVDVDQLYGGVTGYLVENVESGRQSIQALQIGYAFDSVAVNGEIVFRSRGGIAAASIDKGTCVVDGNAAVVTHTRSPAEETAGRVVVSYVRADGDYQAGAADARSPSAQEPSTGQLSLAVVLGEGDAGAVARRSLAEAQVARDTAAFSLPLSRLALVPGDVIEMDGRLYRIDRVDESSRREVSAVRVEVDVYDMPIIRSSRRRGSVVEASKPLSVTFLDLPLLKGDENPVAPYVAVLSRPWLGNAAVYMAEEDRGYSLVGTAGRPATLGTFLDPIPAAYSGLWCPAVVRVQLISGALQSRSETEVLNGANVAAIGTGEGDWEIIQFRQAELGTNPPHYKLSGILRGQAGTDGVAPASWPQGTRFVLLDKAVGQIDLPASVRGLARHYRVGPASRAYDHASYVHRVETFEGVGLRPYSPCHLRAARSADGTIAVAWVRRTRIDGDSWMGADVPLGEESEAYLVRALRNGSVLREETVISPAWLYSAADQAGDGAGSGLTIEVAQISVRFGPGPFERIEFNG